MKIQLDSAIHLLHETSQAVLATHSTIMPGYPYATAVPLVVDDYQRPLLLVSALAEHTKNLLTDPRASLAVTESVAANVQNATRMTLVGDFEPLVPKPEIVARYLRYQREAEHYLQLDFMFFRLKVQRVRFIVGIGKMGWLETSDWHDLSAIAAADEASTLVDAESNLPPGLQLIGFDAYGVDYLVDNFRGRWHFEQAHTVEEIAQSLPELVQTLRKRLPVNAKR